MKAVYQIRNKITGWVYIGSTVNWYRRLKEHSEALDKGNHYNYKLQAAYKTNGAKNFVFEILYPAPLTMTRSELYDVEQEFLDNINEKYNIRKEARDSIQISKIGIVADSKLQSLIKRDIRYYTQLPGQFITTTKQAKEIQAEGGIVIRVKDKFLDRRRLTIYKYQFDYVIQNGNPDKMIYKIENMLAKFGII